MTIEFSEKKIFSEFVDIFSPRREQEKKLSAIRPTPLLYSSDCAARKEATYA
jgi:hypothetical protein